MNIKSSPYQTLLKLGAVKYRDPWPDYLALGFTHSDVQALHQLVSDTELHQASGNSNEVWIPLHAWRILGQLKSTESADVLLSLLDTLLVEDDWALEEMPKVFGMIGPPCIDLLDKYLNESFHDEFARAIAAEGIKFIAVNYPDDRYQCIARLTNYLEHPDKAMKFLNASVIGNLIDLDAKESYEVIRKIYHSGLVDVSVEGDLEDVEISLGLRQERTTPKPNYGQINSSPSEKQIIPDETLADYGRIDNFFLEYGSEYSIICTSELDGFFAAIDCAPTIIMPSQWLPAIWGGLEYAPEWPDKTTVMSFMDCIMRYYNGVATALIEGTYLPLLLTRDIENETVNVADEWCNGFLRGITLWPALSAADASFLTDTIQPMKLFATDQGQAQLDKMSKIEVEFWQHEIPRSVQRLHRRFFEKHLQNSEPIKVNKVGRNDPCPCGSGKKYKYCCLH